MIKRQYSPIQTYFQEYAGSPSGALYLSRYLHHIDRFFLKLSGGRRTMTGLLTGLPVVVMTTTGVKSGKQCKSAALCIRDKDDPAKFAVIATNWGQDHHPDWYFNLKAQPKIGCSLEGNEGEYIAHEAFGEEYDKVWQYAIESFNGFTHYKQNAGKRRIPIIMLELETTT
jgi:deazaflavin-dependent oxidoreductase (nitroreductase family)